MDVYGRKPKKNDGEYFCASIWSWRPIHSLCGIATNMHKKQTGYSDLIPEKTLNGMGENSGRGLRSERKCNLLSDYLKELVDAIFNERIIPFEVEVSDGIKIGVYKNGKFYIDYGSFYVGSAGENRYRPFLNKEDSKDPNIQKWSAYQTDKEHIEEFILFLRNCGGFQVW